ncbi:hypothetical protein AKUH3B203M04_02690 [Apilactobacillus kunkeei]|nr:hypothetical protein AKUH3B203M04_02690 [Apilactobacillus kunkeei]
MEKLYWDQVEYKSKNSILPVPERGLTSLITPIQEFPIFITFTLN